MAVRALSAFISAILLFATPEPNGRFVTGVVTDRNGNELNGAVVQLENEITLSVQSNITGLDGRYHFAGLNPEMDYTLKAHYKDYWSKQRSITRFDSKKHCDVRLVIPMD